MYRERIADGAVIGINPDTLALIVQIGEHLAHDDRPQLAAQLATLEARYNSITGRASYTVLGLENAPQPGDVISKITAGGVVYAHPFTVATVELNAQTQATAVHLVPITAEHARQ